MTLHVYGTHKNSRNGNSQESPAEKSPGPEIRDIGLNWLDMGLWSARATAYFEDAVQKWQIGVTFPLTYPHLWTDSRVVQIYDEGWAERVEDEQEARQGLPDKSQKHEEVHPGCRFTIISRQQVQCAVKGLQKWG